MRRASDIRWPVFAPSSNHHRPATGIIRFVQKVVSTDSDAASERILTAKILIADGGPDLDFLRGRSAMDRRYQFHFARSGPEALQKLQDEPDIMLVVADLHLPILDGLSLLARLTEVNPLVVAIVVATAADAGCLRAAMHRGAVDFLTKPLDMEALDSSFRRALQRADTLRQAAGALSQRPPRRGKRSWSATCNGRCCRAFLRFPTGPRSMSTPA